MHKETQKNIHKETQNDGRRKTGKGKLVLCTLRFTDLLVLWKQEQKENP